MIHKIISMMWTLVKSYVIFLFLTKGSCTLYFECGIKYRVISSNFVNEDWHIQMWVIYENKLYPTAHILERLSQDLSWLLANWMAPRKLCGAMSKLSHQTLSQYLRFLSLQATPAHHRSSAVVGQPSMQWHSLQPDNSRNTQQHNSRRVPVELSTNLRKFSKYSCWKYLLAFPHLSIK